jgi:AraC-like DNA-binding protein
MVRSFGSGYLSTQITGAGYYCPKSKSRHGPLEIICAGWENCQTDYSIARTGFPWLAIELVVQGQGRLEIGGRRYRLQTGSLFAYGPRIPYRVVTEAKRPMLKYFIDFTGSAARRLMAAGPLRPGSILQALYPQELREIMDRILVEGIRETKLSREIANNYLRILLEKIHECAPASSSLGSSRGLTAYLRAKALLDGEYLHLSHGEDAARKLGVTPETLCRLFQRFSKTSPYQYLLQLKINQAVNLLLGTDLLVKEVALRAGFGDPFQFSRTFKSLQGVSPEKFRRLRLRKRDESRSERR